MRNLSIFLLAAVLGACSKKETTEQLPQVDVTVVTPSPLPPPEESQTFTGSTWSLNLPRGFVEEDKPNATVEGLYANKKDKVLISVVKEPFIGTSNSYAFLQIQVLKSAGIPTTNPITLSVNDQEVTLVEGTEEEEDIHVWVWTTTKNGFGYTLTCGGVGDPAQSRPLCSGLSSEFKING